MSSKLGRNPFQNGAKPTISEALTLEPEVLENILEDEKKLSKIERGIVHVTAEAIVLGLKGLFIVKGVLAEFRGPRSVD